MDNIEKIFYELQILNEVKEELTYNPSKNAKQIILEKLQINNYITEDIKNNSINFIIKNIEKENINLININKDKLYSLVQNIISDPYILNYLNDEINIDDKYSDNKKIAIKIIQIFKEYVKTIIQVENVDYNILAENYNNNVNNYLADIKVENKEYEDIKMNTSLILNNMNNIIQCKKIISEVKNKLSDKIQNLSNSQQLKYNEIINYYFYDINSSHFHLKRIESLINDLNQDISKNNYFNKNRCINEILENLYKNDESSLQNKIKLSNINTINNITITLQNIKNISNNYEDLNNKIDSITTVINKINMCNKFNEELNEYINLFEKNIEKNNKQARIQNNSYDLSISDNALSLEEMKKARDDSKSELMKLVIKMHEYKSSKTSLFNKKNKLNAINNLEIVIEEVKTKIENYNKEIKMLEVKTECNDKNEIEYKEIEKVELEIESFNNLINSLYNELQSYLNINITDKNKKDYISLENLDKHIILNTNLIKKYEEYLPYFNNKQNIVLFNSLYNQNNSNIINNKNNVI